MHMLRLSFALLASVTLAACAGPISPQIDTISKRPAENQTTVSARPAVPQSTADVFAKSFLDGIQAQSFAERREFCGYFFRDSAGQVQATPPRRGTFASCNMPVPNRNDGIFASYHTHGAFGPQYDNEVPSPTDLLSDFRLGLDGYISTPGGRVWRVNNATQDAIQICGLSCVARDPGFIPRNERGVRQRYTVASLNQRGGT
jgi:hypothetical protein